VTHQSIKEHSDEEKKEFNIELKLDQMQKEIHQLKQKSDILELQNKVLFERLNHISTEKEASTQVTISPLNTPLGTFLAPVQAGPDDRDAEEIGGESLLFQISFLPITSQPQNQD
jgi:hypothetical protein